jgi:hypothetical protein
MKTYEVRVTRIGYGHARFEVQAYNKEAARRAALVAAGDYEYSESSSDYKVGDVDEVLPNKKGA